MQKKLRLILGDQLNSNHSWLESVEQNTTYVLMEVLPEASYVKHHIQKIIAFFLAMRAFAEKLKSEGHKVVYFKIEDEHNKQGFEGNIKALIEKEDFKKFEYQLPDEYRLDQLLKTFCESIKIESEAYDTEHFLTKRKDLEVFFGGKKTYIMENFYRDMRKKHDILMENGKPLTGQWNYDSENRKKYNPKFDIPKHPRFERDVSDLLELMSKLNIETIGNIEPRKFAWAITREESLEVLDFFIENSLKHFGSFQDAMEPNEPYLFHSRLSFALNTKMLDPLEVVNKIIEHWKEHEDEIDYAQVEGFVRQIIGWREYVRGLYWAKMPDYASLNFFDNRNKLPNFYWTGKTKMFCLSQAINQSLDKAYAHHIQRLMLTGNFALLIGADPDEVDEWYLGIYIDAIEWVEITNTRGMSQFADGGILGTKPYISSANYIDKMSRYCKHCHYDKKKKYGDKACPFNSLYWNFYDKHREKLEKNRRVSMMYHVLDKMTNEGRTKILEQAKDYLENIEDL